MGLSELCSSCQLKETINLCLSRWTLEDLRRPMNANRLSFCSKRTYSILGAGAERTKIAVYTISGVLACAFSLARIGVRITNSALRLELDTITAATLGGTLLIGREGERSLGCC